MLIEEQCGVVLVSNNVSHKNHVLVNVPFPHGSFATAPIVHLSVFLDQKQSVLNNQNRTAIHTFVANVITTTTSGFCAIVRRVSEKMLFKGWNTSSRDDEQVRLCWYATLPTNWLKHVTTQQQQQQQQDNPSQPPLHSAPEYHYHSSIIVQGQAISSAIDNSIIVVTVPVPQTFIQQQQQSQQQQQNAISRITIPNVVVTAHAVNSMSEEVFVPMLREIYADKFVVVLRRVAFESTGNVASPNLDPLQQMQLTMKQPQQQENILKLNWSAFYYNHSQSLHNSIVTQSHERIPLYRQTATVAIGQNSSGHDGVRRQIYLLQFTNRQKPPIADCLICTPRCDPLMPGNQTVSTTVAQVQKDCIWICARQVSPVHNIKDWNFNCYISYLALYKNMRLPKIDPNKSLTTQEEVIVQRFQDIPFNQQLYICNRASGYVMDVTDSQTRPYTKIGLWSNRIFLLSQNQRFLITEDGYIVSALNNNLVLECIKNSVNQPIFINQKRENDNLTQKWVLRKPEFNELTVDDMSDGSKSPRSATTKNESVIIASAADPNYVLECNGLQKGAACVLQKVGSNMNQQWYFKIANSFF
jgi:hypothetical protein